MAGDVAEKSEGVGSAFGIIAENHIVESCDTHEPERRKTTDNVLFAKHKLEFLRGKSKEHLKAWYLHHHLDILAENYERSRDIEEIMDYHKNEYPHTYSEEIRNYLMKHNTELERDLVKVAFRREKQN